jgi:hypothetical protein
MMKLGAIIAFSVAAAAGSPAAQETKPVPKDSVRVAIPGCTKGQIFTAGPRTVEEPGSVNVPEGTHMRMNGPKKLLSEIKGHEGSMIQIIGLMKKGQALPDGVGIGGGVRISPGSPQASGGRQLQARNFDTADQLALRRRPLYGNLLNGFCCRLVLILSGLQDRKRVIGKARESKSGQRALHGLLLPCPARYPRRVRTCNFCPVGRVASTLKSTDRS